MHTRAHGGPAFRGLTEHCCESHYSLSDTPQNCFGTERTIELRVVPPERVADATLTLIEISCVHRLGRCRSLSLRVSRTGKERL